jgi:DNA-binding NarL/FixJ family response regulator
MSPTLLIVDDHEAFRTSASMLLGSEGFEVVGLAADAGEALAEARRLRPDVALVDIRLPDGDGFGLAERLRALPSAPVVVLTSSRDASAYGMALALSSARGFISKANLSGAALAHVVGR